MCSAFDCTRVAFFFRVYGVLIARVRRFDGEVGKDEFPFLWFAKEAKLRAIIMKGKKAMLYPTIVRSNG